MLRNWKALAWSGLRTFNMNLFIAESEHVYREGIVVHVLNQFARRVSLSII
jgi:hypothetical protein